MKTPDRYLWVGNDHMFFAHASTVTTYGITGLGLCGVQISVHSSPASMEKATGLPHCGACQDIIDKEKSQ